MSYAADHLAWQQRINQEFNAASRFMDRSYANKMGSSNPMGTGMSYPSSGMYYAPKVTSGYIAKSRLKGSATSVRSKSLRSGMSRRGQLTRKKPSKRFNEELDAMSRASKPRPQNYPASKPQAFNKAAPAKPIVDEKKQLIDKINKLDETNLEKLVQKPAEPQYDAPIGGNDLGPDENIQNDTLDEQPPAVNDEEAKQKEEQDLHDEIDSLYYGSQYTHTESRRSQLTSATYISKLEKELQEERRAREKLAQELEEIKKLSSEISSHLGLNKDATNK